MYPLQYSRFLEKRIPDWARKFLAWVLVFSLAFPAPVFAVEEEEPVGKIIGIIGKVEYLVSAEEPVAEIKPGEVRPASLEVWEKVKIHQPVYAKDRLRTARKSRVKVLFVDNSLMALGPKSDMSIDAYRHKPEDKLRQGVIKIRRGLSMYIINKTQKNKDSSFKIVTPTGNISARGTHGYIAASPTQTLIGNQSGAVATSSSDPNIKGSQLVGSMMKNTIPQGQPPTPPTAMSAQEGNIFKALVTGTPIAKFKVEKKDATKSDKKSDDKKEKDKKKDDESADSDESDNKSDKKSDKKSESDESADSADSKKSSTSDESAKSDDSGKSDSAAGGEGTTGSGDTGGTGGDPGGGDLPGGDTPAAAEVSSPGGGSGDAGSGGGGEGFFEVLAGGDFGGAGDIGGGPDDFFDPVNDPFEPGEAGGECSP